MTKSFPHYTQLDAMDCGPTCLRMIAKYHGRTVSLDYLREKSQYGKAGVSLLGVAEAAESIGFRAVGAKLTMEQLLNDAPLPAIIHWNQGHFVVLHDIKRSGLLRRFASRNDDSQFSTLNSQFFIADPAAGLLTLDCAEFEKHWVSTTEKDKGKGIALLLEPTPRFKEPDLSGEEEKPSTLNWSFLFNYLNENKSFIFQLFVGIIIGSILQLIFPYLTQSIVDTGINTQNLNFIQIVLAAQLMLLFSQTVVEFIRSRILLYVSTRINLSLLSGFWTKLLRLPMQFFDSKHPGDIIQRVGDHHRIESFLTGTSLNTFFSFINLVLFSVILLNYNVTVFIIFAVGSVLYVLWVRIFLKYRRQLDYKSFDISSRENNATMQLIYGMQEIKLNNAESTYRWAWEGLQARLFKLNFTRLSLSQYQQIGAFFINQGKNILITFIVASLVIDGKLTLGAMLAIQYIIGQLNSPVEQFIGFTQQAQDAKISLERLNDIHALEDEEPLHKQFNHYLPTQQSIHVKKLSFTYPGAGNEPVLKNINVEIPEGKVTAIVGMSGSGKSTLVKLLLRFYDSYKGDIYIGNANVKSISPKFWRSVSGSVMQESFIFNATIQKNITVTDEQVDTERLVKACETANILPFIESLPLGFYTKLGAEGTGISGGQKQRIAIARAVYKNPKFLFFDEATNSLDASNEKVILENLQSFFEGKTVVVVAHWLSTVKNADRILMMDNGEIVEEIISHRPPWIIRWGTVCFFFFLLVIGVICWFIKYPDIVTAQATLTSINAPKPVITTINAKLIKINIKENDIVKQNQVLGYLESTANHAEVLQLATNIDSIQQLLNTNNPEQIGRFFNLSEAQLGELQIPYQTFSQAYLTFTGYLSNGFYLRKKNMLLIDKSNLAKLHTNLLKQKELEEQDLELSQKTFNANETLREKKVLSELDYNDEKSKFLNKKMSLPQINNAIIGNESDQNAKEKELAELDNTIIQQKIIFQQALSTLKSQVDEWKKQYLLIAPTDGKAAFVALIQENQQLQSNQTICYINPENTHYFAQLVIPQANLGKVAVGQKVLLKFSSYPFQEFGAVYGNIEFISPVATDAGYFAKIALQSGLTTNYGKQILYRDGLQGNAEIITKDLRLLQRFYFDLMKQIKR